jgi:TonB family protein
MCATLWLVTSCFGQTLCPKHVEPPTYPPIARAANVQGEVTLKLSIDANGVVTNAEVVNRDQMALPLQESAIENIRRWTFEKPQTGPMTQMIVHKYRLDGSLTVRENYPVTKVVIDLPDRVTILGSEPMMTPDHSKKKTNSH